MYELYKSLCLLELEDDPTIGPYVVGRGGAPNADGVYEFDAAVMRGSDLRVGAVAALQGYDIELILYSFLVYPLDV